MDEVNSKRIEFSNKTIESLAPGDYRDSGERGVAGLFVRVRTRKDGSAVRTYYMGTRLRNSRKGVTVKIGRHGDQMVEIGTDGKQHFAKLGAQAARARAQQIKAQLIGGTNPNEERRQEQAHRELEQAEEKAVQTKQELTLEAVLDDYIRTRSLKDRTGRRYMQLIHRLLYDWLNMPMASITEQMIRERYYQLKTEHKAQALYVMRVLRALFKHAQRVYKDDFGRKLVPDNPVSILTDTQRGFWRKEAPAGRQEVVPVAKLKDWYQAVMSLRNTNAQDYLLLLLFTGLRLTEAGALRWENVDLEERKFTVLDTKNKDNHTLPMSEFVFQLLKARHSEKRAGDIYVFPGRGKTGILDIRDAVTTVKEGADLRVFRAHDLRRTFVTAGVTIGLPFLISKKLVNHKLNDITNEYAGINVDTLREPMEKLAAYFIEKCGIPS